MTFRKSLTRLGRASKHRELMIRNLVGSLIEHERIRTTLVKAKALRRTADRVVAVAKKDNGYNTRKIYDYLNRILLTKHVTAKLMTDLVKRFKKRKGSFVRVIETLPRTRDGSRMAYIEYIDNNLEPLRVYTRPNPLLEKYKSKIDGSLSQLLKKSTKPTLINKPITTQTKSQKSMEDVD